MFPEHGDIHLAGIGKDDPVGGLRGQGDVPAALFAKEAIEDLHGDGDDGFHSGGGRLFDSRCFGAGGRFFTGLPCFDLPFPDYRHGLVVDGHVHGIPDDGASRRSLDRDSRIRRGGRDRAPVKKKAGGYGHGDRRYQPPAPFSAV